MPIHNLNHVNMFLQVIASGSISSAARILRKSHTAVSSAVSNLEIDLCVELVRQDGYKVEPTEQALRLIPYMRSLLNYQQLIGDIAFNLNKGPRNLRVLLDTAIPPSFCDTVSSVLLDDFNMVSLIRTSPADSLATIKQDNAEIDIAITIDEELKISRFNQCALGYTKAFVVAHPQHPLCNASLHSIASLANYRQISLGSRSGQHSNLLRPVSDKVLFVENFDDMLRLVEAGVGWGIAPHYFVEERLRNGTLAVLSELYEPGGIDTKVYCYYNTALESERSFLRFLESARQRLRELGRQRFDDAPAWQPSIVETAQRRSGPKALAYRQRAAPE
ncbi:transcriptional regulator [Pseudomonas aeruginosa]|uniref:multiple virulence factor transcriptional regulator MvfR n=1 Tax=Pseudomonas aeruginosa TaxID=287 RepID=UPI000F52FD5F|nr:multiple virulence factor transcriptional regulator MvfR [Pseudomonas aeruginosa]RPT59235.1 transcriptional regulator [Pseudomonas aeruginosa]